MDNFDPATMTRDQQKLLMSGIWDKAGDKLADTTGLRSETDITKWLYLRARAAKSRDEEFTPELAAAELVERGIIKP